MMIRAASILLAVSGHTWPVRSGMLCMAAIGLALASAAQAQGDRTGSLAATVWDLALGAHALELPKDVFIDYACGTNGGPPSVQIADWTEYHRCPIETATGFHEVYFRYDDELGYWARARSLEIQTSLFGYTSENEIPIIASGLFDEHGFLVGIRMVTDPRVQIELRERGTDLGGFLTARFGDQGWVCLDLPRLEGEQAYHDRYEKRRCEKKPAKAAALIVIETHNYRKPGQHRLHPLTRRPTHGLFVSTTRFELTLTNHGPDVDRIAALGDPGPTDKERRIERASDCPGCDLRGAELKRADLTGANLQGANLAGANLHGAILNGADLEGVNLEKANINRAQLRRANLRGANLRSVMMFETRFNGADLTGADLTQALAGHVQMGGANLGGATMVAMDLRHARLLNANFAGADLTYSWLHDAVLTRSDLSGAKLVEADMWRADLAHADLSGADLQAADLIRANLRGANLTSADLSHARLTFANIWEADITGVNWREAELPAGFVPE